MYSGLAAAAGRAPVIAFPYGGGHSYWHNRRGGAWDRYVVREVIPGAFYFLRERQLPPVDALRRHRVPIALATDSNPGTSPVTSLLLVMNMAATLFRLTIDEIIAAVTRGAARALGQLSEIGTIEPGKIATSPSGTSSARPSSSIGSASIPSMRGCGEADDACCDH